MQDPQLKILRRTFKARRRTELGLLVAAAVIIMAAYTLMILGNTAKVPSDVVPLLVRDAGARRRGPPGQPDLGPERHAGHPAHRLPAQRARVRHDHPHRPRASPPRSPRSRRHGRPPAWLIYVLTLVLVRRSRDLDRYRYLLLAVGVILLLLPLVPHFGANINGARLWVKIGSFQFQPVELAKIVLCIFFASYFAEKRELLSIPTARFRNRLVLDPRPLVPILVAWVFAIGVMSLEHDIGFSALLFTLFIGLLWVTTGRTGYLVLGIVLFAIGAYLASQYFSQTHIRVETGSIPGGSCPATPGCSSVQAWYSLGSGGLGGTGLGLGAGAYTIPVPQPTSSSPSSVRRWGCSARPWWWWRSCCWWAPASASPRRPARSSPSSWPSD